MLFDIKQKSFQEHWMGDKKKNEKDQRSEHEMSHGDNDTLIQRDSLISLHWKKGNTTTIENYRVPCPFLKYHNK